MDDFSDEDADDPMPMEVIENQNTNSVGNQDDTSPEVCVVKNVNKRPLEPTTDVFQKKLKEVGNELSKVVIDVEPNTEKGNEKDGNSSKESPVIPVPVTEIQEKEKSNNPPESTNDDGITILDSTPTKKKAETFIGNPEVRMVEIESLFKQSSEDDIVNRSVVMSKEAVLTIDDTMGNAEEIVIDSDDETNPLSDEETRKHKKRTFECCSFECKSKASGEELFNAPVFVLTYYGVKYVKRKTQKVCKRCFDEAAEHQEHLSHVLSIHKPLLSAKFPLRSETVVIMDSDDDLDDDEEPLGKEVLVDIEDKLFEVIDSTLENYDLDYQLEASKSILGRTVTELEVGFKATDDLLNSLQRTMDRLRGSLYEGFIAPIKEKPPLIISDGMPAPYSPVHHQFPPQYSIPQNVTAPSVESPKRIAVGGVAMKKVTQVARNLLPVPPTPPVAAPPQPEVYMSQDVVALGEVQVPQRPMLPPIGTLLRPRPQPGDLVYVAKSGFYAYWSRAKVLEVQPKSNEPNGLKETSYKVKFESRKSIPFKQVNGKHIAYVSPSPVRYSVGTRVIAFFRDKKYFKECFYAGVIAEPPKSMNNYRYLVFFDDGYAQYVEHEKIMLVCESSRDVWEDIHPESRDFVRKYLLQYPERPMVKLQQGQIVKTEWNGKWWIARVSEVDGSLVNMHFDADGRTEWIYRGSTRLGPLFAELANAASRSSSIGSFRGHRGLGMTSRKKKNRPYVEYTRTDVEEIKMDESGGSGDNKQPSMVTPVRAVAKKSTTRRPESILDKNINLSHPPSLSAEKQHPGKVELQCATTLSKVRPKRFRPHQCGHLCIANVPYDEREYKNYNPLLIPLVCGFQRQHGRLRGKHVILYKAPCGRKVRNMEELHLYLRVTKSRMSVDLFDFDCWVQCYAEYVLEKSFCNIKDLSYGAENVPVPCVNYVDHLTPDYVTYSTKREPMEGVHLNTDPQFLTGCDCTDDCQDRDKCACWQLTIQGTAYGPGGGKLDPTVGYIYKRLPEPVTTGIYECNSRCKCSNTCLNRVAQQPLKLKLQVFKTENRGWGIRCLNDVPQGAFICIYAGRLLTEQGANEGGKNYGDEYLAELDYIEVVERLKEGYEDEALEDDDLEDDGTKLLLPKVDPELPYPSSNDTAPRSHERQLSSVENHSAEKEAPEESGSEAEEEEEGELSQDARDSDEDFTMPGQWKQGRKPEESSGIRTRLRNRASRHDSSDSQDKEKDAQDRDRDSEKGSSDERDGRKDVERRLSHTPSNDDYITLSDDEDAEEGQREPSRFAAVSGPKPEDESHIKYRSVREYFGQDENCYIMDAKNNGNIGRYLNHSCSPNVFVQNVFVDTHDLRFPWVAFFALTYIRSGTELTWDYNYDVGSVAGKVMHCYCGAIECRGRLL